MSDPAEQTPPVDGGEGHPLGPGHEPGTESVAGPPPRPGLGRGARLGVVAIALAGVLFVVTAAMVLPQVAERARPEPVDLTLDAVEVFEDLPTTHTDEDVDYPTEPPVGGPHADRWLDCGVYDEQVPAENLVHDLEHGTVVIAHDPALDKEDVALLADLLPQNGIMTPWVGLDAPVVVTVWGRRLALTGADDPRLPLFVRELGNGETAPEPMASCAGGIEPPEDPGVTQV